MDESCAPSDVKVHSISKSTLPEIEIYFGLLISIYFHDQKEYVKVKLGDFSHTLDSFCFHLKIGGKGKKENDIRDQKDT